MNNKKKLKSKKIIYLDNAATTPIDSGVLKAMTPYLTKEYGNSSSIHYLGQIAFTAIDKSRKVLADFLNCEDKEIVFTGSATEANNLAILGLVRRIKKLDPNRKLNIITSQIEHHAVLSPLKVLENEGVEIIRIPVSKDGIIDLKELKESLNENTILVSVMYANNEIGVIQPIKEIGEMISNFKESLKTKTIFPLFHTDAVQAAYYLDCDVRKNKIDFLTLSAHKIYGPKGVGALFMRKGILIDPLIYGGGQEFSLRAGTENVAGIVGFAEAIKQVKNNKKYIKNIKSLQDKLIKGIIKNIPETKLNGSRLQRLPNNINVTFENIEGEGIVLMLDSEGICASTASACTSKNLEPSHVLRAIGLTYKEAHSSIRFSLSKFTKESDIDYLLKKLPSIIKKLRSLSPFA